MPLNTTFKAKPFLKWAGGKSQLLSAIEKHLPAQQNLHGLTYIEPFVGSGAVFFRIMQQVPGLKHAVINDINTDLITAYQTVKTQARDLIKELKIFQEQYHSLDSGQEKKQFFLEKREDFNDRERVSDSIKRSSLLIFLNKTCYNGLYRVNRRNGFNVPHGRYILPKICDEPTILENSRILQKVTILNGDFPDTLNHCPGKGFFYFDPPYRPLNKTSSFNAYASDAFGDTQQQRLAQFARHLHSNDHLWLLSNSDPRNTQPDDDFFDKLYNGFHIQRVPATRMINSNAQKRGQINELLIYNYPIHP